MDKQLQEKIKLSEQLIDKYISEIAFSAAGVQAATYAASTAQGLGHDAVRIAKWFKAKKEEVKRKREAKRMEKEKQKQLAMKQKMSNKSLS